jgi:hypothetical protein
MRRRIHHPPTEHETVCIAVLEKVDGMLEGKAKKDKAKIEAAIEQFCAKKDLAQQDKKLVRELGGIVWESGIGRRLTDWLAPAWLVWASEGLDAAEGGGRRSRRVSLRLDRSTRCVLVPPAHMD